jgi:dTDP-4-amino-4,6-dideoxygalactose transaminase
VGLSLFDPATPLEPLRERLHARLLEVFDSGTYILGSELRAFEEAFASYLGSRHLLGVGNGTDALTLALLALDVGPGDDVVVPSFTFWASAEAIVPTGARPVFCDIDLDTYCITPETVQAALTPKTKAVIAVDLFGNVPDIPRIEALGVPVLEDAAQAAGSTSDGRHAGSLGTIGSFSFYPSKNLGAFGDGGAVATDDDELAARLRSLRSHGSRDKVTYHEIGYNSRLDELQAALLNELLPHLDEWAAGRRNAAANYEQAGLGEYVSLPQPVSGAEPAWHLYVIRHPEIDTIAEALGAAGIGYKAYYRTPVHKQLPMLEYGDYDLPATEEAAATHLAIPMNPLLSLEDAQQVVEVVAAAVTQGAAV